jgi:hypothetical protein
VALVPLAALVVHELRFIFAYGPSAAGELAATGHSYLHELTPWIVTAFAVGIGLLLVRLARAWRTGTPEVARPASFERLWAAASAGLVAIYAGQELLEGFLATGHPTGLVGILGDGGWWSIPAALLVGAALAVWVRGTAAVVARVARLRATRPAPARPIELRRFTSREVALIAPTPLAASAAGRAPPFLAV